MEETLQPIRDTCNVRSEDTAFVDDQANWALGALDIKTAFLHAKLDDDEDGVYIARPPTLGETWNDS